MTTKGVVGVNVDGVTERIVAAIRSLPHNEVAGLDPSLLAEVVPLLPTSLQGTDAILGLRLAMHEKPSMAHSGWLYSRFLSACQESEADPATVVALYCSGLFREFAQLGALESEALFLGFGQRGAEILKAILEAELHFNPSAFDADGYAK